MSEMVWNFVYEGLFMSEMVRNFVYKGSFMSEMVGNFVYEGLFMSEMVWVQVTIPASSTFNNPSKLIEPLEVTSVLVIVYIHQGNIVLPQWITMNIMAVNCLSMKTICKYSWWITEVSYWNKK